MASYAFKPFAKTPQANLALLDDPAEFTRHPALRTFPVEGTAMSPTLNIGDFVILVPVSEFRGDGVYLVDQGNGTPVLYRAQLWDYDDIHLTHDVMPTQHQSVKRDRFNERVLGMVVAEIRVTDHVALSRAIGLVA